MSVFHISVLSFISVSFCLIGVASLLFDLFFRDRSRIDQRLREEFGEKISQQVQTSPLFKDLKAARGDHKPGDPTLIVRLQTLIDQAGLPWTTTQLATLSLLLPIVIGIPAWLLSDSWLLTSIVIAITIPSPLLAVIFARQQRRALLCRQLPDAFDVMSRALRAGQAIPSAFQVIAQDFPSPVSQEFTHCYEHQHLGVTQEVALRDLARRTGIMELQLFVVAMIVHSRSGGNLAELLSKLASLLRKRANLQNRVRALTGEGRMQAAVLISLPAITFAAMYFLNREYAEILLNRPLLLLGCVLSQAFGAACIYKIVRIDY